MCHVPSRSDGRCEPDRTGAAIRRTTADGTPGGAAGRTGRGTGGTVGAGEHANATDPRPRSPVCDPGGIRGAGLDRQLTPRAWKNRATRGRGGPDGDRIRSRRARWRPGWLRGRALRRVRRPATSRWSRSSGVGGTCLHCGCIPAKELLQTAEVLPHGRRTRPSSACSRRRRRSTCPTPRSASRRSSTA